MSRAPLRVDVATLRITRNDLDAVREHARQGAPDEICGILVGSRSKDAIVVERVVRTGNAHPMPRTQYLIPPAELLRVTLQAEDEWGLEVVGFYHSHPAGPPRLSPTDIARASWPGAAYLLAWLAPDDGIGCWTWDEAARAFVERGLVLR